MTRINYTKPCGFDTLSTEMKESIKVYRLLSISGAVLEYYEKDDDGEWHDITAIKKLEDDIKRQQQEIERLKRRQAMSKALGKLKFGKKEEN